MALELWRSGDHALVLTDLHMPRMDGYQLAVAIRAEEQAPTRTPIVALSANALRDEAERCKAAGIDDYLSKPLLLAQLRSAIEAVLGPAAGPASQPEMVAAERNVLSLPADLRFLRSLVGDDPDVIDEVTESFIESSTRAGAEIEACVRADSLHQAAEAAHKLRAGAQSVGALRLVELCSEFEQTAALCKSRELDDLLPQLLHELGVINDFLHRPRVC